MWSSARFSSTPASGRIFGAQCSWKLDSSAANTSIRGSAVSASYRATPMLPTAAPCSPSMAASMEVVVVLPLVPVTTNQVRFSPHSWAQSPAKASATSPNTGTPASAAASNSGLVGRHPGEVTIATASASSSRASAVVTCRTEKSAATSAPSAESSTTTTSGQPMSLSIAMAPRPETPAPATRTRPERTVATKSRFRISVRLVGSGELIIEIRLPERASHCRRWLRQSC